MTDTPQKKILTRQQYLHALALFTVATDHYRKMREMEFALSDLLGYSDPQHYMSHLSDAVYEDGGGGVAAFDRALALQDFVVEPDA